MDNAQSRLIEAMQQPSCYDHPVDQVELIETHISWVFLAGDFAYKVKKPVDFGFLDFSTLEKRRHFCQEELRLNRRFAPQLYLEVVPIGDAKGKPKLRGQPAQEYAVKMHRFEQRAQLDRMLEAGRLSTAKITAFAALLAELHRTAPVAAGNLPFGSYQAIIEPAEENFAQIRPLLPDEDQRQLNQLDHWSRTIGKALQGIFQQRKANGFIRECHGDLHLGNMAWHEGRPILFDGIEFNENLRWIDVINDIAFLVMDLDDRGQASLGWRFLNCYLQESGDYQGIELLNYYKVYRAMVRAKVTCLRLSQPGLSEEEREQDLKLYHSYLNLATSYTSPRTRVLLITHGLSGSGKTSFAKELAAICGAFHLQSDRERKRLYDLQATADSRSPIDGGIYSAEASRRTYRRLHDLADLLLEAGSQVIVDATFLQTQQRDLLHQLATKQKVPLIILDFDVSETELRRRIQWRGREEKDASEANLEVLEQQLKKQQRLNQEEQRLTISICSDTEPSEVARQIIGFKSCC